MMGLFLDTSSKYLTVGLLKDSKLVDIYFEKLERDLSQYTINVIEKTLKKNDVKPIDIKKIYCVNGPGSFTGIRVGVTIAKVYAWSLDIEIIPVSSLLALACSKEADYIIPLIDARRNYAYAGIYDKNYKNILEDQYISLDELKNRINNLNGKICYVSNDKFSFDVEEYKPELERLVANVRGLGVSAHEFAPNYLKKTEAEEKLEII